MESFCAVQLSSTGEKLIVRTNELLMANDNGVYEIPATDSDICNSEYGTKETLRIARGPLEYPDYIAVAVLGLARSATELESIVNGGTKRVRVPKRQNLTPNVVKNKPLTKKIRLANEKESALATKKVIAAGRRSVVQEADMIFYNRHKPGTSTGKPKNAKSNSMTASSSLKVNGEEISSDPKTNRSNQKNSETVTEAGKSDDVQNIKANDDGLSDLNFDTYSRAISPKEMKTPCMKLPIPNRRILQTVPNHNSTAKPRTTPRASTPHPTTPRPTTSRVTTTDTSSHCTPTPRTPTPRVPTPRAPTLRVPTPRVPTPGTPTPRVPTPRTPTPCTPTPRIPTHRTPTPRTATPCTPCPLQAGNEIEKYKAAAAQSLQLLTQRTTERDKYRKECEMLREEMKKSAESARIGTALSEQLATVEKNLKLYFADMIAAQKAVIGPSAERGMIAVTPNIKMAMKAYIFAKNADSMRKRVNWIVAGYWSWEVRENLYFAPGQSTDLNKRVVTDDEIADIHCVCNILQEESPLQFDCESFEHDLLYWISRKLIVDRSRAKSGMAKCMQTMGAGAGDPNQHEPGADDYDDELSNEDEDENTEKHDGDGTDVEDETQRDKDEGKETQRDADEDEQTQRDADEDEQTQRDPDEDEQTQRDADEETPKNGYEDEETLKDEYEDQEAPRIGFEDADTLVNKGEIEEAFSDDTNEIANGAKESIEATAQEQVVIEILGNVDEAEISTDDIVNQIQVLINE